MAIIKKGYFLNVTLQDSGFNSTSKEYALRGADFAAASTNAASMISALDAVSDAKIARYAISERWYDNAFSAPVAGEVEELAIISVRTSGGNNATVEIPAPIAGAFKGTSGTDKNVVDLTNASVDAYLDQFFAIGGSAYISDGESISVAIEGQRGTKKSRQKRV